MALTWTDAPATLRRDVVTGTLAGLWSDRGVSTATCLADDISGTTLDDVRRIGANDRGLYYLVRSQDACGLSGTHGFDSLGTERLAPSACR